MKTKAYNLVYSVDQEEMDAGLLAETYSVEAKDGKAVQLPDPFTSQIREDLVRSAVLASRANRRQSYGHREHSGKRSPQPGMKHSVEWFSSQWFSSRLNRFQRNDSDRMSFALNSDSADTSSAPTDSFAKFSSITIGTSAELGPACSPAIASHA